MSAALRAIFVNYLEIVYNSGRRNAIEIRHGGGSASIVRNTEGWRCRGDAARRWWKHSECRRLDALQWIPRLPDTAAAVPSPTG
jgi:hypothetical protein